MEPVERCPSCQHAAHRKCFNIYNDNANVIDRQTRMKQCLLCMKANQWACPKREQLVVKIPDTVGDPEDDIINPVDKMKFLVMMYYEMWEKTKRR